MMNIKDEDVNLGLGMGSTKFSLRTRLLSTSGAGVNADSRVNLAFPTSDPLSELVWSPHNGLSLKRANSRAADKKPFLVWNVGPSSTEGLSPLHSIRLNRSGDDNVVDQGNLSLSQTVLHADDMIIEKATWLKASGSRHSSDLDGSESNRIAEDEADKKDAIQEENCEVDQEAYSCHPQIVQTDGIAETSQEIAERSKEETSAVNPATPLKKLESSAENDLCHLTEKDDCSLRGAELPRENDLPAEDSPMSSRICLHWEMGKGKALSDGDIYGRSSDEEDDSHESAESSNSAGSKGIKGKKRQIYDNGVILGSKRMRKQIHGSHGSTFVTRPDNSFMNWITNMTKVSPLTLACPSGVYGKNCHESSMCFKPQDSSSISMGFQTIFQSLYYRETDLLNAGGKKIAESVEESRECTVDDKKSPENLPESCDRNCGNSSEHAILCSKEVDPIVASKPCLLSSNVDQFLYPSESNLAKNNTSEDLISDRGKDGLIPSDALGEEKKITAKEAYPDIPVAMSDVLEESNPLPSCWITRLSTKAPRSEKGKEIAEETNGCSTPCMKADLDSRMNVVFPIEQKSSETRDESADSKFNASMKESRNFIINSEASFEVKSISKLCPTLPSQRFSSEAMASVFARRLDALRHITSSKKGKFLTCSHICFFCGDCHDVRECLNVTKPELEDLLLKLSTFDRVEESSCLCIRCSRSDHWAIACPLAPSSWQRISDSEQKASLVSQCGARHLQVYDGEGEDHKLVAADHTDCSSRKPLLGFFPTYQTWKFEISSSKRVPASSEMQRSPASKWTKDVDDGQSFPLCDIATLQNTVAQSEMFDAIRNLRLTRADILRWMNSNVSSSHLNGCFLRLRLGKLEAGLGGSSYYVACITGDVRENDGCTSKKSILVDVGGIKSSVSSQYVSNHDFLEDEIKAWWCRTVDSGCRIPSLVELNSKFNDRKTLGF